MYISVLTRVLVSPWKGGFKLHHIWQCTMFCCSTTLKYCETTSRCGVSGLHVVHLTGLKTILCSAWKNNHPISGWSVYDVFACHFAEKTRRKDVSDWHSCWCYISSRDTVPCKSIYPLELFHILSRFNYKCQRILLGFYVIDQHKVVYNCQVEGQWYR